MFNFKTTKVEISVTNNVSIYIMEHRNQNEQIPNIPTCCEIYFVSLSLYFETLTWISRLIYFVRRGDASSDHIEIGPTVSYRSG